MSHSKLLPTRSWASRSSDQSKRNLEVDWLVTIILGIMTEENTKYIIYLRNVYIIYVGENSDAEKPNSIEKKKKKRNRLQNQSAR